MTGEVTLAPASETEVLRQQLLQAQRLSSVGELASSIAHEFNNILTTIINSAKLGMRNPEGTEKQQAFERIVKAGQRAATIAGGMLGFAAKRHAPYQVRYRPAGRRSADPDRKGPDQASRSRRDAIRLATLGVGRAGADRTDPGQPRHQCRQAMPTGGRLKIEVRETEGGDMVEVKVADTGVGIPPEQLRMIFEPFFTTKQPDEYGRGGTGLGLSVCRQIIEQHHGRIRVESVAGAGSTFTVKLPKRLPDDPV